jgi:spermidine synthase
MVHPAMLFLGGEAARVCCIGGGPDGVVCELLRYRRVRRVVHVDMDASAVEVGQRYQASVPPRHWDDPRYELVIDDALEYLASTGGRFDLVVNEVSPPLPGSAAAEILTEEACELIRSRLVDDRGLYVTWAGSLGPRPGDLALRITHLIRSVFLHVHPYVTLPPPSDATWLTVMASLRPLDPLAVGIAEIDARLAASVDGQLAMYDGVTHHHMFLLPKDVRRMLAIG